MQTGPITSAAKLAVVRKVHANGHTVSKHGYTREERSELRIKCYSAGPWPHQEVKRKTVANSRYGMIERRFDCRSRSHGLS